MRKPEGRLKRWAGALDKRGLGELSRVMGPWAGLPRDFGAGKRTRLFSPLKDLLAVSFPGAWRGRILPGGAQAIPGVAVSGRGEDNFAQHGGLL